MEKRLVRRGCGTVRMVALLSAAAMMLAAGLTLASCASSENAAIPAPVNPEPAKSDVLKSAPAKDDVVGQPEPVKASEAHGTEIDQNPSQDQALREGKDEITVLVLNACGVEGAAAEAAGKVKALGFKNVTVGNATYYYPENRVSYHHEEHRAEVEEVAALFEPLMSFDPYCYEDAWSGGWSMDYDILVMLGNPIAS